MGHEQRIAEGFMKPGQRQANAQPADPNQHWVRMKSGWAKCSPEGAAKWQAMGREVRQAAEQPE